MVAWVPEAVARREGILTTVGSSAQLIESMTVDECGLVIVMHTNCIS